MINIRTFTFNSFQVNTYLLSDETKEAILIDPACDSLKENELLIDYIEQNSLILKKIVNTHGHIDHIVGINKIKEHFNVPFLIHEGDNFLLETAMQSAAIFGFNLVSVPFPDSFLNEGDGLSFGNSKIELLHVPGHSPGSIVFYSPENNFIIAGDVLFNGSIGRTDLPGGDYDTLIAGIKQKLLTLPGKTVTYPGHGPSTTIQNEITTNPFLA